MEKNNNFNILYSMNLNDKVEKKNGLTYLSWAFAWAEFKKVYPSATYRVKTNPETNLPYFSDPQMGIMVYTEVTADDLTYQMWLPILDGANKPMKQEPYTYQVWDSYKKAYQEKTVQAASMFDVNRALMRCLVKNLSMFGLGLYIYSGEDLPEDSSKDVEDKVCDSKPQMTSPVKRTSNPRRSISTPTAQKKEDKYATAINACTTYQELLNLYREHALEISDQPEVLALFTEKKKQLLLVA